MTVAQETAGAAADLVALVGERAVFLDEVERHRFETDERRGHGLAAGVIQPTTPQQVSQVLAYAVRRRLPLLVQGANTGLNGAGIPDLSGRQWILSLDRLCAPPRIDVMNRSATVAAGVRLSILNAAAEAHGLTFPIDLGADPSLGGMVAANTGGARFIRFGDVRRNLLGLQAVLADADGTIVELGNDVWKNNTGLDLKQLFVGSSGAMGVVTSVTVGLQPLVSGCVTALVALAGDLEVPDILTAVERCFGPLLTAFEGMSGVAVRTALSAIPNLSNPFPPGLSPDYCLLIEIADPLDDAERIQERLGDCLNPFFGECSVIDVLIGPPERLWALRHALPEGLRASGQVIACDLCVRRGDTARFRAAAGAMIRREWPELTLCDFGHVGDGGLHFNLVAPFDRALTADAVEQVRTIVLGLAAGDFGGAFSAEHGVGPRNLALYATTTPAGVRALAGRVQHLFNPSGVGRVDFRGEMIGHGVA